MFYNIYTYIQTKKINQKTEAQSVFLGPFTVCSSRKRKFVICLSVDEEKNRSHPFANGLDRLNRLDAHTKRLLTKRLLDKTSPNKTST